MSICAAEKRPVFWERQARVPVDVQRVLRVRLEAAFFTPRDRALLLWPMLLGAPAQRAQHPHGIPESVLFAKVAPMLGPLGMQLSPETLFHDSLRRFPDTALQGPEGWLPHPAWADHGDWLSLRAGVALLALMGLPDDEGYPLAAGVALFNEALYHPAHDAWERLWKEARGRLRRGLQGLILLAGGYHHQQMHHVPGMQALWRGALEAFLPLDGPLETPWGSVSLEQPLNVTAQRMAWLAARAPDTSLTGLWDLPRPLLEVMRDA